MNICDNLEMKLFFTENKNKENELSTGINNLIDYYFNWKDYYKIKYHFVKKKKELH